MDTFTVIFDACVLYPAPLRDLLMQLANTDLFRARWTDTIHDEWTRNLLKNRNDLDPAKLQRTRELMNANVDGCLITGYEQLIPNLTLPDPDDRHILAAAIAGQADLIVTFNLVDFPSDALSTYELEAQHPDDFLTHLLDLSPVVVFNAFKRQLANLKNPPYSAQKLLDTLERQKLPQTVVKLREFVSGVDGL